MTSRSGFFKEHNQHSNPTHWSHSREFKPNTLDQFIRLQHNFGECVKGWKKDPKQPKHGAQRCADYEEEAKKDVDQPGNMAFAKLPDVLIQDLSVKQENLISAENQVLVWSCLEFQV